MSRLFDKKDLPALWSVGLVFAIIFTLGGIAWRPPHYRLVPSKSLDPQEAQVDNNQRMILVDALNRGKIDYDPVSMSKVVKPAPFWPTVIADAAKILLFPTLPLLILATLTKLSLQLRRK